jgi:hypothetical protein
VFAVGVFVAENLGSLSLLPFNLTPKFKPSAIQTAPSIALER